jgi:hypothetical protein
MAESVSELGISCGQRALIVVGLSEISDRLNVILNVVQSRVLQEIALGIDIPFLCSKVAQNAFILDHPSQIGGVRSVDEC